MNKKLFLLPLCFLFSLVTITAMAAGFVQNGDNWQYEYVSGEKAADSMITAGSEKYYFNMDGNMVKDALVEYDNNFYYFDGEGKALKNTWKKISDGETGEEFWYYFGNAGKARKSGWLTDNGEKYHFTDYHMDYGWYTDENGKEYFLNGKDDGHMVTGWLPYTEDESLEHDDGRTHNGGWYYFIPETGVMVKETEKKIGTKYYAFAADGVMIDGFGMVENPNPETLADLYILKYYDKVTGVRADGWRYVEEAENEDPQMSREEGWYYFKNGVAYSAYSNTKIVSLTKGIAKINGEYYAFDQNGKMVKGLIQTEMDDPDYNGRYYYFGDDGKMKTGYVRVEESEESIDYPADSLYFNPNGVSLPMHGITVTGIAGNMLYDNGARIEAVSDRFELVKISNGHTYIVGENGVVRKTGTVTLYDGTKMKISFDGVNYSWEKVETKK